ncbi:Nn.00g025590.m01.CDS01 [Neocucurbitaria sp. VM-36]
MSEIPAVTPRRLRVTRACDFCHRRGRKCRLSEARPEECTTCITHGVVCSWDRVVAKRGVKPRQQGAEPLDCSLDERRHGTGAWLTALINIYFADVYPIICTIHEASFRAQWEVGNIPNGPASRARIIAMCAISAQRVASGASCVPSDLTGAIAPEIYIKDGTTAVMRSLRELRDKDWLQTVHLLAVVAMEVGDAPLFHQMMGLCCSMVADQGLIEEGRWPDDISPMQREELRRLIWHLYRLEVHTALIMGSAVRILELQINVDYPGDPSFDSDAQDTGDAEWLGGWNFVTDLYRGLEHVLVAFRARGHILRSSQKARLPGAPMLTDENKAELLLYLRKKYHDLPRQLKAATRMAPSSGRDRCVFQYANIICTYQLVKMLSYASGQVTFRDACQTVLDLVDGISTIPVNYLKAMSLAMVQELSGFGHLLGSFITKNLCRAEYEHLRSVMYFASFNAHLAQLTRFQALYVRSSGLPSFFYPDCA